MRIFKCISRLMTSFGSGSLLAFFCCVLAVSFPSFAQADVMWGGNTDSYPYSSASDACQAMGPHYDAGGYVFSSVDSITVASGTQDTCHITQTFPGYGYTNQTQYFVYRQGDTCSSGKTIDATNSCTAPTNKCTAAQGTSTTWYWRSSSDTPAATVSVNGCEATVSGVSICKNTAKGYYSCSGTATITGNQLAAASGDDSGTCTGADCTSGDPQKTSNSTPCTMISGGSGTSSCTTSDNSSDPGTTKCGTMNGSWICTESPKSKSSDATSDITETKTVNSDGSTTTKTTTVTNTTTCSGVNTCTSGTTTTVTTGGTTSSGASTGSSTSCTGSRCDTSAGDAAAQSDAGDDDDDDDDDDSVSGDMACTAVVTCSGDAIQCAVLRQEQQSRCADKDFRDLSDDKINSAKATSDAEFAGADYQELKPDADHTFALDGMIDTSSRFGASCPVLPVVAVPWLAGNSVSFDPNVPGLCDFFAWFGFLNVAFAMREAAKIIGQGVA